MPNTNWHTLPLKQIYDDLASNDTGLSSAEVSNRQKQYGWNKLPEGKVDTLIRIFFRQFQNPLIYILLVAAGIVLLLGKFVDSAVVLFVLVFNAISGTIQEGRAQNTLQALKKMAGSQARVLRDNKEVIIKDVEVVPGDIVILQEGDKVPADARIVSAYNLKIDEASLTGESTPVAKNHHALKHEQVPIADRTNMAFKGTYIVSGTGTAVIVGTGLHTEIGKIASQVAQIDTEIPLKKDIEKLSQLILITVLTISVSLLLLGLAAGIAWQEIFIVVVSLAISIIPEGLPIVMTLILAKGVWDMSKRNVLVKRLQAVEALGQTKIIAVDKTGTLTKNEMTVTRVYVNGQTFTVEANGYEPTGSVMLNGQKINVNDFPGVGLLGMLGALSTTAQVFKDEQENRWKVSGEPTEAAMQIFAEKVGYIKQVVETKHPKIFEMPFDYISKCHAVINKVGDKQQLSVGGAPEQLLSFCDKYWDNGAAKTFTAEKKAELEQVLNDLANQGLRVVAAAVDEDFRGNPEQWQTKNDLAFVGLFGIEDGLRPEVRPAMKAVTEAGMKVIMITGDHKLTAQAIAKEAGIYHDGDHILSGTELEQMTPDELLQRLPQTSVFVRVTPEHKLKIVQAYKKLGLVIAMTGDGVNDAPSLVAADLGVGMGKIGTEVAKEASDIVLMDDNFGSIVAGVEEGRNIYKTLQKALLFLLSTGLGEVILLSASLIIGMVTNMPLPLLPVQILWVNLVGDGILGIFFAYEPKDEGLLSEKFKKSGSYIIDAKLIRRLVPMSIVMAAGTIFIFITNYQSDYIKALTMSFTTLAMYQWLNAWNCKTTRTTLFSRKSLRNLPMIGTTMLVVVLHLAAIYTPLLQKVFNTKPLALADWAAVIPVAVLIVVVDEIIKYFRRRKISHKPAII